MNLLFNMGSLARTCKGVLLKLKLKEAHFALILLQTPIGGEREVFSLVRNCSIFLPIMPK